MIANTRTRALAFVALVLIVTIATGAYLYAAHLRNVRLNSVVVAPANPAALADVRRQSHVAFRSLQPGAAYGTLAFAPLADPASDPVGTALHCHRLYSAAGETMCLAVTTDTQHRYQAVVLDDQLAPEHVLDFTAGSPSRVRVSRDGRMAAYTVFTARDSYMQIGFSTRTVLVDLRSGRNVGDLEDFEAWRDGQPFRAVDFNYWGVTFSPVADRFYATLGTSGHTYLVEASIAQRRVTVVRDGIECPSLSPDGTRIAFKKKFVEGRRTTWRPAVVTLATGAEVVLAETRSIDDQIEWLDDATILYGMRTPPVIGRQGNIWKLAADGTGEPAVFLENAESPAIVRR
jgi:hypothetical protein